MTGKSAQMHHRHLTIASAIADAVTPWAPTVLGGFTSANSQIICDKMLPEDEESIILDLDKCQSLNKGS